MPKTIDEIIVKANKLYGDDTLIRGNQLHSMEVKRCTTGSLAFDTMLGGGWPLNQWNEVIGQESHGKTVMALKTIAANMAMKKNYQCLWVAAEEFVPDWAESLGVDLSRITLATTNIMEEAYQICIDTLDSRAVDAIVIDSLPALVPGEEDEKVMQEFAVGLGARLTGKFMRKSGKAAKRSLVDPLDPPCLGLIINQWREKIGILFGDPRTTPGGKAKNFSFFTRVEVARDEWIVLDDKAKTKVGLAIKARTIKNKTAPPQRVAVVDFYFADCPPFHQGDYDTAKEVVSLALAYDIITRTSEKSSYYEYDGLKWQGREAVLESVREEVDLYKKLSKEVLVEMARK